MSPADLSLLTAWAVFALAALCGVLGGCLLHVTLEKPLMRLFKARFSGKSAISRPNEPQSQSA